MTISVITCRASSFLVTQLDNARCIMRNTTGIQPTFVQRHCWCSFSFRQAFSSSITAKRARCMLIVSKQSRSSILQHSRRLHFSLSSRVPSPHMILISGTVSGRHESWEFDSGARDLSPEPHSLQKLVEAAAGGTGNMLDLANKVSPRQAIIPAIILAIARVTRPSYRYGLG